MRADPELLDMIASLDASITGFNQDGRTSRERATKRAYRLTGLPWSYSALLIIEALRYITAVRMTELAGLMGTTPPTMTKLVKDLEGKGFIQRAADEQDGRASIVSLTDEGRRVADAIAAARLENLQQALAGWGKDDLGRLTVLFDRLRADMHHMA